MFVGLVNLIAWVGASASPFCLKMGTPSPQKAFLQWFSETAPRFAVPVQIKEPNDRLGSTIQDRTEDAGSLHLEFTGNPALSAALINSEINITVEWQGECWDFLLSLDVLPKETADGYVCGYCLSAMPSDSRSAGTKPEERTIFPSLEALWRDHLFEPFLQWVNEKLAVAHTIGLYGSPSGGWTHADLLSNHDTRRTKPDIRIPLRVSQHQ
jgi:hypothetical protein